ncbi:MAG: hypothetical protein ACKV2T_11860 [Kofleriaceae bacterium]
MPKARVLSGFILLGLGLVAIVIGTVLLVSNKTTATGIGGAMSGLTSVVGGGFVLGGLVALAIGSLALASGRRAPPADTPPDARLSRSLVPGVVLLLVGILLGVAGLLGSQAWVMVPGILAGLGGLFLFARSGSPDEPA